MSVDLPELVAWCREWATDHPGELVGLSRIQQQKMIIAALIDEYGALAASDFFDRLPWLWRALDEHGLLDDDRDR